MSRRGRDWAGTRAAARFGAHPLPALKPSIRSSQWAESVFPGRATVSFARAAITIVHSVEDLTEFTVTSRRQKSESMVSAGWLLLRCMREGLFHASLA